MMVICFIYIHDIDCMKSQVMLALSWSLAKRNLKSFDKRKSQITQQKNASEQSPLDTQKHTSHKHNL